MYRFTLHPVLLLIIYFTIEAATKVVVTTNGTVEGDKCSSTASNYFLSIPFADPPLGALRFKSPQPFSGSYNGTLNGTKPAPFCIQFGTSDISPELESEDCLYLDIYAPSNASSTSRLPVKVWLYGGTFQDGGISDPSFTGCTSSADAVVVTVNYRLGPLGYLALENTTLIGNYGTQDQLQALRWVQDNIAAFGGDPERVLLFGQSAGATACFALATLPEIKSLAKGVAMESGGGVELPTVSTAQRFHNQFVSALNCSATDLDCILSKTPQQLNAAFIKIPTNKTVAVISLEDYQGAAYPWSPLVGSALFPLQPAQVGVQIPAIFGSNGLEGSLFAILTFGYHVKNLTATDYTHFLKVNFGPFAAEVSERYPLSVFNGSVFQAISIVMRDYSFRCPAYRGATIAAGKGLPVWTYSFNQTPSCPSDQGMSPEILDLLGPTHGAEIPFVFGEVAGLPLPNGNCSFTAGEKRISAFMKDAWTAMGRDGAPGSAWPAFSPNTSSGINFQADEVRPGVVDYSMCTFWDQINTALNQAVINSSSTAPVSSDSSSPSTSIATSSSKNGLLSLLTAVVLMAWLC